MSINLRSLNFTQHQSEFPAKVRLLGGRSVTVPLRERVLRLASPPGPYVTFPLPFVCAKLFRFKIFCPKCLFQM